MALIDKVLEAQQEVYGDLHSIPDAADWDPPERSDGHRGRYLWTDAFGVINFLTLFKETGEPKYLTLARRLVETVHDVLARTRDGKSRLPGASDEMPLGGGLRIGKEDVSGPDCDGQYHHYLTLWMFALNRLSKATSDARWNDLAVQLAKSIHPNFFVGRGTDNARMVWKLKIDLSESLVHSQGRMDPIDGYITFKILQASAEKPVLEEEIHDYWSIVARQIPHPPGYDALDLGHTLWIGNWLAETWVVDLRKVCARQAWELFQIGYFDAQESGRIAYREYGTCLGIACAAPSLESYRQRLIAYWEGKRPFDSCKAMSEVMRAAAIMPGAFQPGYFGDATVL